MQIAEAVPDAPAGPGSSRRARRREESRERLYVAALELFTRRGYKATTMDAIAEHADVARGTVFNHFPEKVAFLVEWGRRRRAHVAELVAAEPAGLGAGRAVRRYLHEMAALNVATREQTVVLMDASARHGALLADVALAEALAALVEDGRRAGEFRTDVVPDEVGALLASVYFSAVLQWIAAPSAPFDLIARIAGMVTVVLRGVAAAA